MSPSNFSTGRLDLPREGSSLKDRHKLNQRPGRVGTMRAWIINAVEELCGLDFTVKKAPKEKEKEKVEVAKKPEEEEPKDAKKKKDIVEKTAA